MKNYTIALLLTSLLIGVSETLAQPSAPTLSEQTLRDAEKERGASRSLYDQGGGFNVIQLIHNANLRGNTTPEQFQQRQNESLDEAINALRRQRSGELNVDFSGGSTK
jgi:hypothetical protein